MTGSAGPQSGHHQSGPDSGQRSDPERVLSQALRAMAGGRPAPNRVPDAVDHNGDDGEGHDRSGRRRSRLTIGQILLIAAIVGIVIGMGIGLATVATR